MSDFLINYFKKYENFDINIINIIQNYVNDIKSYEIKFFNHILPNIEKKFLKNYYKNIDFDILYDNKKKYENKIKYLNSFELEIYDIENEPSVILKFNPITNIFEFKWLFMKSNTFESNISEITINRFKKILINTKKTMFSLIEIYDISYDNFICLHCVMVELIQSNIFQNTEYITKLKKMISNENE